MLAGALALGGACYATGYAPVLYCQANMHDALVHLAQADRLLRSNPGSVQAASELDQADQCLQAAARSDRLDPQPWRQLAEDEFARWQRQPDEETLRRVEEYVQQVLERERNSAAAWCAAGAKFRTAFQQTRQPALGQEAIRAYQRAIELYPNNGVLHGEFALLLAAVGDREAFRREAQRHCSWTREPPTPTRSSRRIASRTSQPAAS